MIWFKVIHDGFRIEEHEVTSVTKKQIAYKRRDGVCRWEPLEASDRDHISGFKWFEDSNEAAEYLWGLLDVDMVRSIKSFLRSTQMLQEIEQSLSINRIGHLRASVMAKLEWSQILQTAKMFNVQVQYRYTEYEKGEWTSLQKLTDTVIERIRDDASIEEIKLTMTI